MSEARQAEPQKTKLNINRAAQALGRLGGKAGTGKSKARTSEQARAAVMVRWSKPGARKLAKKGQKSKV